MQNGMNVQERFDGSKDILESLAPQSFLDHTLYEDVSKAIHHSTNGVSEYKSGFLVKAVEGFYDGPFSDPGFSYRLKQSLDVYWEDDGLGNERQYQQAEDFITAACDIHSKIFCLGSKRKQTRFEIFRKVNRAKQILDSTEEFQFDLGQLARECIMSKYCLVRNFKQLFQVPPQKYFTARKMEFARSLLAKGNHIGNVAYRLGYPDVFSFGKQFKKYVGVSPGKIRKIKTDLPEAA